MSEQSDRELTRVQRLKRIRENRDRCLAGTTVTSLPELHRDRNWLLQLVEDMDAYIEELTMDERHRETASKIRMDHIFK